MFRYNLIQIPSSKQGNFRQVAAEIYYNGLTQPWYLTAILSTGSASVGAVKYSNSYNICDQQIFVSFGGAERSRVDRNRKKARY